MIAFVIGVLLGVVLGVHADLVVNKFNELVTVVKDKFSKK
jgi:hypothetical protein